MKPYKTIRLTECPDIRDIQNEGRKSSVGRRYKGRVLSEHGYTRKPRAKKQARRFLKRKDRAFQIALEKEG